MKRIASRLTLLIISLLIASLLSASLLNVLTPLPIFAQTVEKPDIVLRVNQARIVNGLAPLAFSPALERAAQRHSDDMAAKGFVDHTGSDGSSPEDRIIDAGYAAWPSTRVWAENVYAGSQGFVEALDFFMADEAQRRNLLNPRYREMGIGVAATTSAAGTQTVYWTLTFGAQPNVLPIFINDGVTLINMPQIAIHLTQEEAVPGGEGAIMGNAIEVRVSSDPEFRDANWQKWEPLLPFTFDDTPGLKTVYVQLRDGGGRSTISTASVQYDPNSTPQVAPLGPGAAITPILPVDVTPAATPTVFATVAPVQTVQPSIDQPGARPVGTATSVALIVTPQGTAVFNPIPSAQPTSEARPLVDRPDAMLPDWLLPTYLVAQMMVIVLGVVAFFRLKRP